jgi:hypothetical protein
MGPLRTQTAIFLGAEEIAVARGRCEGIQIHGFDWAEIRCTLGDNARAVLLRRHNPKRHKTGHAEFSKRRFAMNRESSVSPQAIMAEAVLDATKKGRTLEVEEMSRLFLDLKKKGVPLGEIALRKVPGGVYSEDAEAFVGRFLAAGYAEARSPIKFSERGLEICRDIVQKEIAENLENLQVAFSALGFETPKPLAVRREQPQLV